MSAGDESANRSGEKSEAAAVLQADFLSLLANRHRMHILFLLSEREYSISELMRELQQTPIAVSRHLTILRESNVIVGRRCGQSVRYSLVCKKVGTMVRAIAEMYCDSDDH